MGDFVEVHCDKPSYTPFCRTTKQHINVLTEMYEFVKEHDTDTFTLFDIGDVGNLLRIYYEFHSNKKFEQTFQYSFGFEGFLDNLRGIKKHMEDGTIHNVQVDNTRPCSFKEQSYPLHINNEKCVKNNCDLKKSMIITGPNASGKTTLLKTTTLNIIFSQQIGCGFYKSGSIHPYTHIHSYLNIPDTSQRDSLFQAESSRCKDILDIIQSASKTSRHFGIFDELYSGTNPDEATKSGYAFLKYLSKYMNVDFILTTHYNKICLKLNKNENIQNYKMNVIEKEDGKLDYTYKMRRGISKVQGAIKILEDMKYPKEIIDEVKNFNKKSKDPSTEMVDEKKIQKHD